MYSKIVLVNGKNSDTLNVLNRVVHFGDGVFETCLVKNRRLLFWDKHFARLEKGRIKLMISVVEQKIWLTEITKAILLAELDNCVIKIILSRGESLRGYAFDGDIVPSRIIIVTNIPKKTPQHYSLTICKSGYADNKLLAGIKHCNRLEQVLARAYMDADECIMLSNNNNIISVTQGNIFIIKDNLLLTPDLTECGINGTRRDIVFELANRLGLELVVKNLSINELLDADEVFISNTIIGIKAISKINNKQFNNHLITNNIKDAFLSLQELKNMSINV